MDVPPGQASRSDGKGWVVWGGALTGTAPANPLAPIYPGYDLTAALLGRSGSAAGFQFPRSPALHPPHARRNAKSTSSRTAPPRPLETNAAFRIDGRPPERWDAVTGARYSLPEYSSKGGITTISAAIRALGKLFRRLPQTGGSRGTRRGGRSTSPRLPPSPRWPAPGKCRSTGAGRAIGPRPLRRARRLEPPPRTGNQILLRHRHLPEHLRSADGGDRLFTSILARSRSWPA